VCLDAREGRASRKTQHPRSDRARDNHRAVTLRQEMVRLAERTACHERALREGLAFKLIDGHTATLDLRRECDARTQPITGKSVRDAEKRRDPRFREMNPSVNHLLRDSIGHASAIEVLVQRTQDARRRPRPTPPRKSTEHSFNSRANSRTLDTCSDTRIDKVRLEKNEARTTRAHASRATNRNHGSCTKSANNHMLHTMTIAELLDDLRKHIIKRCFLRRTSKVVNTFE
jgi:hypothetical protein